MIKIREKQPRWNIMMTSVIATTCYGFSLETAIGAADDFRQDWAKVCTMRVAVDRGWNVFFDTGSTVLSSRAQAILKSLATEWKTDGGGAIALRVFTDDYEARNMPADFVFHRGEAVRRFLVDQGIPINRIYVDTTQVMPMPVPKEPGVSEILNRTVQVEPSDIGYKRDWRKRAACLELYKQNCRQGNLNPDQDRVCDEVLRYVQPGYGLPD